MNSGTQGPNSLLGQSVGGYRLERLLGVGATGAVFLGKRREDTPRVVERTQALPIEFPDEAAIKVLIVPWNLDARVREDFHARFVREAQTLQRLGHPHIVPVLDYGDDPATGFTYITLPHMAGGTLTSHLEQHGGSLPLADIARVLSQIAAAVDYAHSQNVVHRDIKPGNILLDTQGQAYLSDFSIVRLLVETQSRHTSTGRIMGTPEYMAPEQFSGRDIGPAADIYGLGMVAYTLVTGNVAFSGTSMMEVMQLVALEPPPPPRERRADLPAPAEAAILRALAKAPADRFPTAAAFADAFALGLQGIWADGLTVYMSPDPSPVQTAQTVNDAAHTPTQSASRAQALVTQPTSRSRLRQLALIGVVAALLLIVACVAGSFAVPGASMLALWAPRTPTVGTTQLAYATHTATHGATRATATPKKKNDGGVSTPVGGGGGGGNGGPAPKATFTSVPPPPPTFTSVPPPPPTFTSVPPPPPPTFTPVPPPPTPSIQIGWSTTHQSWIWMTLSNFTTGTYQYTCHFSGGYLGPYTFTVYYQPETWDNGQTCQTAIVNNQVYVTIGSVKSNTITYP